MIRFQIVLMVFAFSMPAWAQQLTKDERDLAWRQKIETLAQDMGNLSFGYHCGLVDQVTGGMVRLTLMRQADDVDDRYGSSGSRERWNAMLNDGGKAGYRRGTPEACANFISHPELTLAFKEWVAAMSTPD